MLLIIVGMFSATTDSELNVNEDLSHLEREKVVNLIDGYELLFKPHIGSDSAKGIIHKINLRNPNVSPININPYRIPLSLEVEVEAELKKLLDHDIIEELTSE